ncbi:putative Suppressor of protein silencing 3 [Hibiscus syriacus]|uniref:Suppressor of protein silencing 3 n=1 Tax=Hibiscus syriacus TaxID=106335 RepID=A0A6A3AFA6_HIBSY|nr:putative Suppressor of protein silencing 3 [Hibiscus syriacus]
MASAFAGDNPVRSMSRSMSSNRSLSRRNMSLTSGSRRGWASASIRGAWNNQTDVFQRSGREEDEEELKWAAIERLPTNDRIRQAMLKHALDEGKIGYEQVDITNLDMNDKKNLMERDAYPGTRALPTLLNSTFNAVEGVLGLIKLSPSKKRVVNILRDVNGIVKPSRMTLLLGPPGSGKTTLLQSLAGKIDTGLRVSGKITYCGHEFEEFIPQRTSAYIRNMIFTMAGIKPDPEIDAFMKATAMAGQNTSLVTDYVLKILGLDICSDIMVGEMLVGPAKALFMDEISTGLDSSTTFQIVRFMKQMVHIMDVTMLISLLQPAPETYNLFDDIILLSEGKTNSSTGVEKMSLTQYVSVPKFVEHFNSFHVGQKLNDELRIPYDKSRTHQAALVKQKYGISNWELFKACFAREWLLMKQLALTIFRLPVFFKQRDFLFYPAWAFVRLQPNLKSGSSFKKMCSPSTDMAVKNNLDNSFSCAANQAPSKRGMVLPFQPLSLAFDHVNYYVDMPAEMKSQGIEETRLQLLRDVSGAFRPGVLTALVGVSGAGKTTLMDVLAGRKTGVYIEGSISISGYPKNQQTFARVTGYCEQNDIHSPHVTVFESLVYSAWLRLAKDMFVEEVMELVELNPLKNSLVGLPGVNGLSTEQRKRLTIAVELVANPSIIFMDEPTSGLDARAAAIVMRTVRNTVDTGRTVVCTIHQHSIDIFEAFDELFLMKRGGQVIYAGPLGRHSHKLIKYFEAVLGVPKIKEGCNPATWMPDISSTAVEAQLDVDFSEIYAKSELYRKNEELIKDLSIPVPGTKDLHFPTTYSQDFFTQCKACFWKQHNSYWRNPQYNAIRFFMTFFVGLIFRMIFWGKGDKIRLCLQPPQWFPAASTAATSQPKTPEAPTPAVHAMAMGHHPICEQRRTQGQRQKRETEINREKRNTEKQNTTNDLNNNAAKKQKRKKKEEEKLTEEAPTTGSHQNLRKTEGRSDLFNGVKIKFFGHRMRWPAVMVTAADGCRPVTSFPPMREARERPERILALSLLEREFWTLYRPSRTTSFREGLCVIKGIDPSVNCLIGKPSSMDKKCSNQVILNSKVRQWAEDLQRQEGDSLQDDYVSDLASYAPVSLKRNDMQDLRSIWESWDSNKKWQFYQTYGDIPYLLYVEVDDELLRALIQFWNPGYNCFTLNKEDLVPTIEEYTTLLHIEGALENPIYSKSIKTQPFRVKLAKIAGVREEWVASRTKQKGESEGIAWTNIKELIQSHPDIKVRFDLFALGMYGMVIFPKVLGYVEAAVVDLFEQLPKKINPASAILAETFRSLNACRKLGGGRFSGCTQLLYVWVRSHFWSTEKISYRRFNTDYSPLKEFLEQEWPKEIKKDMWINAFRNLQSNDIVWRAPWQIQREFFYKCGDYNWIMLLGLWGGIGYAPLLVIRQYEGRQFVPVTAGLQSSEFAFHSKNYKRNIMEAVTAWKTTFCIRAKAAKEMLTPDYEEWRSARKNENIPLPDQKEDISMEDRIKVVPSEIEILRAEFKAERENWSKELEQMRQDKAMLGVDIDFHSSQCAMLRKDKEKVDDEFRALQKNYQELYKSRKASGSSQATIQMTRELNIEKSRVEHLKGKNSHLLKSLEKGKQKMEDFEVDRRERIIKHKAEHREIMNEMRRERDRAKDLEDMKNDIFDKFEGEKNIMFKGFESEMNQLIAELEVRGQKMEESNVEKEKWELERKNFNTRLEVEQEVASNWMQRCRNKDVQIQKLSQRTQEARTKLEEDLDQSRNKNTEFNAYIVQLEESLFQEKVRLGPNDLKESNEESASLRRRIRDLEKILLNCQVRITELEQTLEGTNEQWQKSTDFYVERSEERSNMVFEAMVQMSEVARYVGELAVEAKIIEHHVDPVSKCGKKVSWLMKEVIELNRKTMPYL